MLNDKDKINKMLDGFTFIDLFAGIGAFRLALESFGAKCVFSSEIDEDACDVYNKNYGEYPSGDIVDIDAKDIPKHDILCAGFPCQSFSIAGRQEGFADTRGILFFEITRIAAEHRPKIILLENVRNFMSHDKGRTFSTVKKCLEDLGYDVYAEVLNASDYGIPQARKRVFIVCFRKELKITDYKFPYPIPLENHLYNFLDKTFIPENLYVNNETTKIRVLNENDEYNHLVRIGDINFGRQGERIYSDRGCSATISASGGGPGHSTGMYLINGRVRRLTVHEAMRLMGFPDDFILPDSQNSAFALLGNSIVVDVIQYIIISIITCFFKKDLEQVKIKNASRTDNIIDNNEIKKKKDSSDFSKELEEAAKDFEAKYGETGKVCFNDKKNLYQRLYIVAKKQNITVNELVESYGYKRVIKKTRTKKSSEIDDS